MLYEGEMCMKRIIAALALLLAIAGMTLLTACEPMVEDYESDTFELGSSSLS